MRQRLGAYDTLQCQSALVDAWVHDVLDDIQRERKSGVSLLIISLGLGGLSPTTSLRNRRTD